MKKRMHILCLSCLISGLLFIVRPETFADADKAPRYSCPVAGKLQVVFHEDADLDVVKEQFNKLGLNLPKETLMSDHTFLATPHRNQAKEFGRLLKEDPLIKNIDYTYTDDNLSQFHEHIEEDTAYLWITLVKPVRETEIRNWEKKYPLLADVALRDRTEESFRVVVVENTTGRESFGGYSNPWYAKLSYTIDVPAGEETSYLRQIRNLSTVQNVQRVYAVCLEPRGPGAE